MDWSNRDKSYTQRFVEFIEECVDDVYMYNLSLDSKDTIERIRILREGFIESEHLLLEKRINPEWSSLELELDKGLQQHEITSACERVIDTWTREGFEGAVQLGREETKRQCKRNREMTREVARELYVSRLIWFIKSSWWLCPLLYIALCLICGRTLRFEPMSWK